jgi:tetratricopeptide (TPR) repeat protein
MEEHPMPILYALLVATFVWACSSLCAFGQLQIHGDTRAPVEQRGARADDLPNTARDSDAPMQSSSSPVVELDPVAFRDFLPGVATTAQLDAKWGSPLSDTIKNGTGKRSYEVAPFAQVDVTFDQDKAASIVVHFAEPAPLEATRDEYVPRSANPVEVFDDRGRPLGLAFPERGVVFAYAPGGNDVAQMLFETIDPETFFMRAERNQHRAPQQSLADLEFVLTKRGKHGPALALAAKIFFEAGQLADAAAQIDAALQVEPASAAYSLTKAEILAESGDFSASEQICIEVLKQPAIAQESKARAYCLYGDVLANGPKRDFKQAIEHHLAAIQTAEQLAQSSHAAIRRAAKRVLVVANLGAANDIAWGYWQQKEKVAPKWLVAAHEAAEDLINQEGADEALHLLVLRRALAASAGTQGKLDPVTWTKEVVATGRRLIDASDDSWRRSRLEWELGLALYDALQADQARGYHEHALSNSSLVAKYLESALRQRTETPQSTYLLGRLYFRIGAIHAVELSDHRTAVAWFEKALPLLERPLPSTALADVGRLGESFVSMGISFWETNERETAVRLTNHGISLVSQGVKAGVIEPNSLSVPYSNLAFMHRELGDSRRAENYAQMASQVSESRRE